MMDILLVVFTTLSTLFFISYLIVLNKFKKISKDLVKLYVDNAVMQEYIDIIKTEETISKDDEVIDRENFIKFLSDSRDWAFEYIENVQKELQTFVSAVDPDLEYFEQYGEVGSAYPHYDSMKRISVAYKELKSLLPKETTHE
jgi:hypothetical protein